MNRTKILVLFLIILCFILPCCGNVFNPPVKGGVAVASSAEDGYGKLYIRFEGDEGRTVFPAKDFLEYVYTFNRYDALDGENQIESLVLEPGAGGVFTVEVGFWAVDVKAYAGEIEEERLAASGASGIIEIETGPTRQITITLEEIIPVDAEAGTFSYTITYPDDAEISIFTLQKLPSFGVYDLPPLNPDELTPEQYGITETGVPVPAGFYLLTVRLTREGKHTGINEVIHIYPHLETKYSESFSVSDFLDVTISISIISGVTPPAYGETPVAEIAVTAQYSGTVTWNPAHVTFQAVTQYTAEITLEPNPGFTFAGVAADFFTVAGATSVSNGQHNGIVTAVFPETQVAPPVAVSENDIPDIIVPVVGLAPVSGELINSSQYTGTVEWNPNHSTFRTGTTYTATITLTAKPGYTFTGVAADFFTVDRASTVNNGANSGVVTAVFTPAVVTFNSNGGNMVDPVHTFRVYPYPRPAYPVLGEKYDLDDPEVDDFTFAGWFFDEDLTNPVTFPSALHDRYDIVTSDITLHAKWLPGEWKMIDADPDTLADMFPMIDDGEGNLIQDPGALDGDYFLTDDISLDGYTGPGGTGWTPMGTSEENPFTGTFDGNGRKITYLFIEMEGTRCVGLFGAINSAEIRNLGVEIHDNGVTGLLDVGGITGNAKNSLIENCYVKGSISAIQSVGGIAAHIGSNSIVRNCYTEGAVESSTGDAGGIVGNMKDGGTIEKCYSTMTVIAAFEAGGIVAIVQDRYYPELVPQPEGLAVINCVAINPSITLTGNSSVRPLYAGPIVGIIEVGSIGSSSGGPFEPHNIGANTPPRFHGPIVIENNYALNALPSAAPTGHNDAARNGISRTDTLLKSKFTYESLQWEFDPDEGPWKMPGPDGAGYPKLYWEQD